MTFKASAGGAKASANVAWVQSIWDEYYSRKQSAQDASFDFSCCGDLPFNFYDAEIEEV
jgi:hypothetical protein